MNKNLTKVNKEFAFDYRIKDLLFFSISSEPNSPNHTTITISRNDIFILENDPSVIYLNMSIQKPSKDEYVDDNIGYFPTYYDLESTQKYLYIKWLENICMPAPSGFLFILLYCLERNIVMGNTEKAIEAIHYLRKYHSNASFQSHSLSSIIYCVVKYKMSQELLKISIDNSEQYYWNNPELYYLYFSRKTIKDYDFIKLVLSLHCTKYSYMKNKRKEYSICFEKYVYEKCGKINITLSDLVGDIEFVYKETCSLINICIENRDKIIMLPEIFNNTKFREKIKEIHKNIQKKL